MADKALHGTVLVIDDIYGAVSKETKNKPYDRTNFESDFGHLPFRFVFSTALDETVGQYTVEEAIRAVEKEKIDGVLLDITFGKNHEDRLGLAILRELTARFPALPVIMMTSVARDEAWAESARLGAVDYLPKPLNARMLWQTLDRYVGVGPKHWLVGQSSSFLEAVMQAAQASEGGRTAVMITGDTGTGKELLARYIGRHGSRASGQFVPASLSSLPSDLQHVELFGAKKGSHDKAYEDRKGYFETADKGVVFLDEIGNIDLQTQQNLLRVLEDSQIMRLGESLPRQVDVQIVSATNADLGRKMKEGEFRDDLYFRLCRRLVHLPSLAQRRDDILLLIRHMLRYEALERKKRIPMLPRQIEVELEQFPWEGNVRGPGSYAQSVFDLAEYRGVEPDEVVFREALELQAKTALRTSSAEAPTEQPPPTMEVQDYPIAGALSPAEQIQQCRLAEFAVLHRLYEQTRHPATRKENRKAAATLLKGEPVDSTNEFDRPVRNAWNALTPESRERAVRQFPALAQLAQKLIERKRNKPKRSRESGS